MNGDPISHRYNNRRFLAWPDLGQTRKTPGPNWASSGPTLAQGLGNPLELLRKTLPGQSKQPKLLLNLLISLSETRLQRQLCQVCGN